MASDFPTRFESVEALVRSERPSFPVFCVRPEAIAESAQRFREAFPGRVLYALKCNPHPWVLDALHRGGIRHFDAASLPEIAQVRSAFPDAHAYFMHPVKDREAIRRAYDQHGVRHFVVDHEAELAKVLDETGGTDLVILVRIATPEAAQVLYHLAAKFGAETEEAAELVREAHGRGCRVGLTFHVGSQCLEPKAYRVALERVGQVVASSGIEPVCLDVGGGFPHCYHDAEVPPLEDYVAHVVAGVEALGLRSPCDLWCEPGRALVAGGCSLVAQVKLRKDERLFINDGVYGSFSELIDSEQELPARLLRAEERAPGTPRAFVVNGPTCDSMDVFSSPLVLPDDVAEGDWIEIDQIGAYSNALATRFNGFGLETFARVFDAPVAGSREPEPARPSAGA